MCSAALPEAVRQHRCLTAVGDDELREVLLNFSWESVIVEKPVHHHHVKSIFTWSPICRQLMVTHNKLLTANLHFVPCWYTVSCKLPLCKVLELTAYAECWFEFLTICEAAWYMISVVSVCLFVCMYVCMYVRIYVYQMITFESLQSPFT